MMMTETKATSLAAAIREANSGGVVMLIPAENIRPNPKNFYSMDPDELQELATSIEAQGLIDPIKVKPDEDGPGYMIVDGERRFRAMTEILGRAAVRALIVTPMDEIAEELMLIEANRTQRKMTAADLSKQAERLTELYTKLKALGVEIPGRLRDRVAEALQVSSTKLARLHAIRENLVPELLAKFDAGEINESKAYEISRTSEGFQHTLEDKPKWFIEKLNIGIAADNFDAAQRRTAEPEPEPVTKSDTDTGWDAEAYLSQRRQEDDDFYLMLGLAADHFLAELAYVTSRQDGIQTLKEHFGSDHHGRWYDEVSVTCSPKGLELGCEDRAIPYILRTWTDVYDMLSRIALSRASRTSRVSESDTAPAGLVWHETETEGPPPAGTRNVIVWGSDGLRKPNEEVLLQTIEKFPDVCRWWAAVEGPEVSA